MIMEQLLKHEDRLRGSFFGRIIARNSNLEDYKRRQNDWIKQHESSEKKMEVFKDILPVKDSGNTVRNNLFSNLRMIQ
jgi:hypothetical protein